MPVRIGVDVGGTFTKAVACDSATGRIVARAVASTTHAAREGVAEGVVDALGAVISEVEAGRFGPVVLVAHSTTQAVNALLEGDAAAVGVLGIGRPPDLKRARRRTEVGAIALAPGRALATHHEFLDASAGLGAPRIAAAVERLKAAGAEVVCASEAFGVEEPYGERAALATAGACGLPACAGHELTGLYGLEMRTVTAAINASILPAALRTATFVEAAVARHAPGVPVLMMRGDGGAAGMATMKRRPLLTAFSGPAASVAGALRHLAVRDGVVVEVGGTSTNVSTISKGRPVLSYVRVLDHVTCVRSLDVRVVGVAGGSLLRVGRRLGRARLDDVGPRSAHISGLPYCSFTPAAAVEGATVELSSPVPGDPGAYVVLRCRDGARLALTVTCAANALGLVPEGAFARGDEAAGRAGFEALGKHLGVAWQDAARRALDLAAAKVAAAVTEATAAQSMPAPEIVGVGGGAGALVPFLAASLGLEWRIPEDAEVISSVGDALSLVRFEIERTLEPHSPAALRDLYKEAEEAAIAAGAAPGTVHVEGTTVPERGSVRVVATGSAALGAPTGEPGGDLSDDALRSVAETDLGPSLSLVARTPGYAVFSAGAKGKAHERARFTVLDVTGSVACSGEGSVVAGTGPEVAHQLEALVPRLVRHYGPLAVAPAVRIVRGSRLTDLTMLSKPDQALEAALEECTLAGGGNIVALLSRH